MTLLGIDIGTTHCKVGLFDLNGSTLKIAKASMVIHYAPEGYAFFDPETLWETVADMIREVASIQSGSIMAVGIASMAESGILVERKTGFPRSPIIPWFDKSAQAEADKIAAKSEPLDFYVRTGLRMSYKCSLAKLIWLRTCDATYTQQTIWLSVADYIAYRLTGVFGTDYSLAGRTGAFDIRNKQWDKKWLEEWELRPDLFPAPHFSGETIGYTIAKWTNLGLPQGVPVGISGHDHLCAAFACSGYSSDQVFDSMGTAEVLMGGFPERTLTEADYLSGLLSGCHVARDQTYWSGSLSTSGGAVEWLRGLLNDEPLSYDELMKLVNDADPQPTGILFFPYLSGSGAPHSDPLTRAAWIGLCSKHTRADLAKAVLEGTAYEMEFVRRSGEKMTGHPIRLLMAAGGGTRNRMWLQIKADVSGCAIQVSQEPDATLLGAALVAGIGCGIYADGESAHASLTRQPMITIEPNYKRHMIYDALFEHGYLELQAPLRRFSTSEALQVIPKDNKTSDS
jgi:sugar (pentulose or hexulose) kinase